jgi:hypothetical protein
MSQHYSNPARESEDTALPDVEVFQVTSTVLGECFDQHTPGPWTVTNDSDTPWRQIADCGDSLFVVTAVTDNLVTHKHAKANARLIAAAPETARQRDELLEALRTSVKSLEWATTVIKDIPGECNFMQTLNEARAAIAKAGGAK